MNWVAVSGEIFSWSAWLWRNWPQFQAMVSSNPSRLAQSIDDPFNAVRRIGNRLIFGNAEGGSQVIGFVEQAGPQLDAINNASGKLDALQLGRQALASSLSVVQLLSAVSLGFTAIVPVALFAAYSSLRRH